MELRDNEKYEAAAKGKQVLTLTHFHTILILGNFPNTYQIAESLSYVTNDVGLCTYVFIIKSNITSIKSKKKSIFVAWQTE